MTRIVRGRMAPDIEGDFVVFMTGMRINSFWRADIWGKATVAVLRMMKELRTESEWGLLGYRVVRGARNFGTIQYWRSFEHLHRYARSKQGEHLPGWAWLNRTMARSSAVGFWHEAYLVRAGEYEGIYVHMPRYGLGEATGLVPAAGKLRTSLGRLNRSDGSDAPAEVGDYDNVEG